MDVLQIHSQLEFFSDQDDLKRQLQTCPKPVCVCKEKDSELSILSLNFIASSIHPIRSFIQPSIQSIPLSIHPSIHPSNPHLSFCPVCRIENRGGRVYRSQLICVCLDSNSRVVSDTEKIIHKLYDRWINRWMNE